jgi:hypothetical protein
MDVKHQDARLLREALNFVFKGATKTQQNYIKNVLAEYAIRVRPYCDHNDSVEMFLPDDTPVNACLDCGHRTIKTQ